MLKRDEHGKFAPTKEVEDFGYYSKLLKKPFDTKEELKAAEKEYNDAHAVELKKAEERKTEAKEIEEAIKHRDELLEKSYKTKNDAYRTYLEAVESARKAYEETCGSVEAETREAAKAVDEKLREFCKKYPGGYHATIKYDDGTTKTYSYNYSEPSTLPAVDLFDRLFRIW